MRKIVYTLSFLFSASFLFASPQITKKEFYSCSEKFPKNPVGIKIVGHFVAMAFSNGGFYLTPDPHYGEKDVGRRFVVENGQIQPDVPYTFDENKYLEVTSSSFLGQYSVKISYGKVDLDKINNKRIDISQINQNVYVSIDKPTINVGESATLTVKYTANVVCNIQFDGASSNNDFSIIGGGQQSVNQYDLQNPNNVTRAGIYTITAKRTGSFGISGLTIKVNPSKLIYNSLGNGQYTSQFVSTTDYTLSVPPCHIEVVDQPLNDPDSEKYGGPSTSVILKLLPNIRQNCKKVLRGKPLESILLPNIPSGTVMFPVKIIQDVFSPEVLFYKDEYDEWHVIDKPNSAQLY
jgi:hypothetical protein